MTRLRAIRNSNPQFLPTIGSSMPRLRSRRSRPSIISSSRNGRSRSVIARRELSTGLFSNMRACCCARSTNARSRTANGSRNFATARANHWSWIFFPPNRSTTITRFCDSTDSLTDLAAQFGADDPLVKKVLAGKSPHARAVELVTGTKLKDVALRKDLYGKDAAALQAAHDPMIDLARMIDGASAEKRERFTKRRMKSKNRRMQILRRRVLPLKARAIIRTRPSRFGFPMEPCAAMRRTENKFPPFTDFAGLYQRSAEHDNKPPFDLPQRWIDKKPNLNLATNFNFVSDADIIGGNSGSPVVNKANEFVGIIFDGNIQSLVTRLHLHRQASARRLSRFRRHHEALRKVYDAGALADELEGVKR